MEFEGYFQHLQEPAICPYPEPDQSNPCPPLHYLKIQLNIILLSRLGSSKWSLYLRFPLYASLLSSICATCPTQIILFDLITLIIFGEKYRALSSSLCSFLHSPVTLSLIDPHILLSTLFSKHLQPTLFCQCEWPSLTPIQDNRQNCCYVYLNKLKDKRFCTEW